MLGNAKDACKPCLAYGVQLFRRYSTRKRVSGTLSLWIDRVVDLGIGITTQVLPQTSPKILPNLWLLLVPGRPRCGDDKTFQMCRIDCFGDQE